MLTLLFYTTSSNVFIYFACLIEKINDTLKTVMFKNIFTLNNNLNNYL